MKVSEAVAGVLMDRGVRQVFALLGSGNLVVTNALSLLALNLQPRGMRRARSRWQTRTLASADSLAYVPCTRGQG